MALTDKSRAKTETELAAYDRRVKEIRSDTRSSNEGRREALAEAYNGTKAKLDGFRAESEPGPGPPPRRAAAIPTSPAETRPARNEEAPTPMNGRRFLLVVLHAC